jgi:hypothetical protein
MRIKQISLLGLLAITTCVALSISHSITSYRLWHANKELTTLRQRLELIPIEDVRQIAARQLPSSDPRVRRWAVRIPITGSKVLYANWGTIPLAEIRDLRANSTHAFSLVPDPSTHEATIVLRVETNATNPKHGTVTFEVGDSKSVVAIDQEITSLLTGETACSSASIGEKPALRPADSPMTLLEIESNQTPKIGFCLWLDQPVTQNVK